MKKIESKNLIVKSNKLVEANYRLSAGEQKVLYKLITSISKDDEDFKEYEFRVSEFLDLLGVKNNKKYDEVKKVTYDLLGKKLTIYDEELKRLTQVTWLAQAVYYDGTGIVKLAFAPALKPYLLQLSEHFTKFDISNVLQMRSGYSARIYELLKQYELIGFRIFELQELRIKLGIGDDEYPLYANFKDKVLKQAYKEINKKTDLHFEYSEIKEGRKVAKIKFIIQSNNSDFSPEDTNNNNQQDVDGVISDFKSLYHGNLNRHCTSLMLKNKGLEHVKDCLNNFKKVLPREQIVENIGGLFYRFVIDGLTEPTKYTNHMQYANFTHDNDDEDLEKYYDQ